MGQACVFGMAHFCFADSDRDYSFLLGRLILLTCLRSTSVLLGFHLALCRGTEGQRTSLMGNPCLRNGLLTAVAELVLPCPGHESKRSGVNVWQNLGSKPI